MKDIFLAQAVPLQLKLGTTQVDQETSKAQVIKICLISILHGFLRYTKIT